MIKRLIPLMAIVALFIQSCNQDSQKTFSVSGKITNANAKMIYLEQVPLQMTQPLIVDSAELTTDGKYSLKAQAVEEGVYSLRLDQQQYPIASLINDNTSIQVDVTMSKGSISFPEKYEVKNSPASEKMKQFMTNFNDKMMALVSNASRLDSLQQNKTPDSLLASLKNKNNQVAADLKTFALQSIKEASSPALSIFELGYYQSTANGQDIGMEAFNNDEINNIINNVAAGNPDHGGIAQLKKTIQQQMAMEAEKNWVGKEAPDFTLPDVNGIPVALSSLKGKYVLVDFWASWCTPCRAENPNVVAAYDHFKDKNFTILGVSLDENKDSWLKAIKNDKLAWQHVSDLKFWNSAVVPLYKFDGIPFNILLDPQGKVLAQGLRGSALQKKLSELLGE